MYPPQPRPPRRTGWIVYSVIVTFFLLLAILANLALFSVGLGKTVRSREGHAKMYDEQYVQGDVDARNKIAVIYLTGIISSINDGRTSEEGMVGDIRDQLQQAVDDHRVKAIIVRINSPGGEVVASDAIYQLIANTRQSKPVVASIDALGASGAYYAAMGASYVMATDVSITGSIGVILESFSVGDLMQKIGVKSYTFKSGRYKDLLNPTREPTDDEKQLVQSMIQEVYDKFVGIVAAERGQNVNDLKTGLADGRILSGRQAKESGLINGLGYFDDAVEKAKTLAKIDKAKVIRYTPPFSLRNLLRIFGQSDRAKIEVVLTPNPMKLECGKLYYLPAYMFQ
jgi:protease-4